MSWGRVLEDRVLTVIGVLEPKGEEVQGGENYVMRTSIIGTRHQILVGAANVGGIDEWGVRWG